MILFQIIFILILQIDFKELRRTLICADKADFKTDFNIAFGDMMNIA